MFTLSAKGTEPGVHGNDSIVIRLARFDTQFIKAESIKFICLWIISFVAHHWSLRGLDVIPTRNLEAIFEGEIFEDLAALGG